MARRKPKKRAPDDSGNSCIKKSPVPLGLMRFSFKLFDQTDGELCPPNFEDGYTQSLMQRLQALSERSIDEFMKKYEKEWRNHRIAWAGTAREQGFSHLNDQFQSYEPWQFQISKSQHGRVHGLIIEDCFYVIWLDCNHQLHPSRN